jgi:hypothetical protein
LKTRDVTVSPDASLGLATAMGCICRFDDDILEAYAGNVGTDLREDRGVALSPVKMTILPPGSTRMVAPSNGASPVSSV